ncbi:hypothetical protein BC833DRAFT_605709 [Globomyces pollinis-pini]|nr:hypothetical protein BC833DRAFT_605709 [Globomyces pollinis-pini]
MNNILILCSFYSLIMAAPTDCSLPNTLCFDSPVYLDSPFSIYWPSTMLPIGNQLSLALYSGEYGQVPCQLPLSSSLLFKFDTSNSIIDSTSLVSNLTVTIPSFVESVQSSQMQFFIHLSSGVVCMDRKIQFHANRTANINPLPLPNTNSNDSIGNNSTLLLTLILVSLGLSVLCPLFICLYMYTIRKSVSKNDTQPIFSEDKSRGSIHSNVYNSSLMGSITSNPLLKQPNEYHMNPFHQTSAEHRMANYQSFHNYENINRLQTFQSTETKLNEEDSYHYHTMAKSEPKVVMLDQKVPLRRKTFHSESLYNTFHFGTSKDSSIDLDDYDLVYGQHSNTVEIEDEMNYGVDKQYRYHNDENLLNSQIQTFNSVEYEKQKQLQIDLSESVSLNNLSAIKSDRTHASDRSSKLNRTEEGIRKTAHDHVTVWLASSAVSEHSEDDV